MASVCRRLCIRRDRDLSAGGRLRGKSSIVRPPISLIGDLVTPEQRLPAVAMYLFALNLGVADRSRNRGLSLADRSFSSSSFWRFSVRRPPTAIIALACLPQRPSARPGSGLARSGRSVPRRESRYPPPFLISFLAATNSSSPRSNVKPARRSRSGSRQCSAIAARTIRPAPVRSNPVVLSIMFRG